MMFTVPVRRLPRCCLQVAALCVYIFAFAQGLRADSYTYAIFDGPGGPGSTSLAGINDSGQIIGTSNGQGFLYSGGSFATLPGTPAGINNNGEVVGYFPRLSNNSPGFLYDSGSYSTINIPAEIASVSLSSVSYAGINDAGVVVGSYSGFAGNVYGGYGFTYSNSTLSPTGFIGMYSSFTGINDSGTIVGAFKSSLYGGPEGFIFPNKMLSYPEAATGVDEMTSFIAINNTGQILGNYSYRLPMGQYGSTYTLVSGYFIYSDGKFTDLNLPTGYQASSLNDEGQIVGAASTVSGVVDGFIATPVPEIDPSSAASSVALLGAVLLIVHETSGKRSS